MHSCSTTPRERRIGWKRAADERVCGMAGTSTRAWRGRGRERAFRTATSVLWNRILRTGKPTVSMKALCCNNRRRVQGRLVLGITPEPGLADLAKPSYYGVPVPGISHDLQIAWSGGPRLAHRGRSGLSFRFSVRGTPSNPFRPPRRSHAAGDQPAGTVPGTRYGLPKPSTTARLAGVQVEVPHGRYLATRMGPLRGPEWRVPLIGAMIDPGRGGVQVANIGRVNPPPFLLISSKYRNAHGV